MKKSFSFLTKFRVSKSLITAGVVAISFLGCNDASAFFSFSKHSASSVTLDSLKVREQFYPEGFEQELQVNLDFFRDGAGIDPDTLVPYDTIQYEDGVIRPFHYTNTSEVGLYLNILVEVERAGNEKALTRIREVLGMLEGAPKKHGLFYWPMNIDNGKLVPGDGRIAPAVDNGNFALAMAAVAGAYMDSSDPVKQSIVQRIEALLEAQIPGWLSLYDPESGLLRGSWEGDELTEYLVDRKANESRTAAVWAPLITKNLGEDAIPATVFTDMEVHTTQYTLNGKVYNPMLTWDGTYFQALMPAIWLNEKELMPDYTMVEDMTALQRFYARENKIPMISSSATVDNHYKPFGIPQLSEAYVMFDEEIAGASTGTPHATALSYMVDKEEALKDLKALKALYPQIETDMGWYDSLDGKGGMSTKILSLDQGMFVGAFLADSINADVEHYMKAKGYWDDIQTMYQTFIVE